MAVITVRFYSLWRQYLGVNSVSLEADNIEDALAKIEDEFGARLREQLKIDGMQANGKLQDYSLILLNGTSLRNLRQKDLKDGDVLQIFPPASGG